MTSTTRQRVRFRCTSERCRHRFAKRKRWWQAHSSEPKCPACGAPSREIEQERLRELAAQDRCSCMPYPFPHRAGSLRMCTQHVLADVPPTDDEIRDYESLLATPRTA